MRRGAKECRSDRSRQEFPNEHLVLKCGFDTAGNDSLKFAKRECRDGIECMDQHRPAPTPAPIPTTPPPPVDLNPAHDYERFALPTPRPTLSPVRPFSIRRDYILKYSTAAVYPHQSTLSRAESGSERIWHAYSALVPCARSPSYEGGGHVVRLNQASR